MFKYHITIIATASVWSRSIKGSNIVIFCMLIILQHPSLRIIFLSYLFHLQILKISCKNYNWTRLPVTRWVKLCLNFEFLVPNYVNEFLLG